MVPSITDVWGYDRKFCSSSSSSRYIQYVLSHVCLGLSNHLVHEGKILHNDHFVMDSCLHLLLPNNNAQYASVSY